MELRKAHKNENFLKRRNITLSSLPDEEALSPDYIPNELVSFQKPFNNSTKTSRDSNNIPVIQVTHLSIEDIIKDVNSDCRKSQTRGCQAAR